jgi:DNA-binding NarL/FixJ family response regulator
MCPLQERRLHKQKCGTTQRCAIPIAHACSRFGYILLLFIAILFRYCPTDAFRRIGLYGLSACPMPFETQSPEAPLRPTTIVIADDHPLIRQGLRTALESAGETVVGEAADGVATLAVIAETQPDLVILDIDMPKMNGLAVMRHLGGEPTRPKIICLSLHNAEDIIAESLTLGASAFLLKQSAIPEIQVAVHEVIAGREYLSPAVTRSLLRAKLSASEQPQPQAEDLTMMERRILRGVSENKTSKEIAEDLSIHFRTVENYRTNICRKLGLSGSNALLRYALQHQRQL